MTTTINYTLFYSRSGMPFLTTATMIQNDRGHIFHNDYNTIAPNCHYDLAQMWQSFQTFRKEDANITREEWQTSRGFRTWSITKVWEG